MVPAPPGRAPAAARGSQCVGVHMLSLSWVAAWEQAGSRPTASSPSQTLRYTRPDGMWGLQCGIVALTLFSLDPSQGLLLWGAKSRQPWDKPWGQEETLLQAGPTPGPDGGGPPVRVSSQRKSAESRGGGAAVPEGL